MDKEIIREFQRLINLSDDKLAYANAQIDRYDKITQDLLHYMELTDEEDWDEDVACDLAETRRLRRQYKDISLWFTPICVLLNQNDNIMYVVDSMLEKVSNVDLHFENREYKPRVTSDEEDV